MKKTLYSTTALAAAGLLTFGASDAFAQAAAPAAPQKLQMAIGGFFTAYAGYASNSTKASTDSGITANYNSFDIKNDSEINLKGTVALDNGMKVYLQIEFETDPATAGGNTTNGNTTAQVALDESYLGIDTNGYGDIRIGNQKLASGTVGGISAPTAGGLNKMNGDTSLWVVRPSSGMTIASAFAGLSGADQNRINYLSPTIAGFRLGAGYTPSTTETDALPVVGGTVGTETQIADVGLTYGFDLAGAAIRLGTTFVSNSGTASASSEQVSFGSDVKLGDFTVGGQWVHAWNAQHDGKSAAAPANSGKQESWNAGVAYAPGPYKVALRTQQTTHEGVRTISGSDKAISYSLSGNYVLGPGVELVGDVIRMEWRDEANVAASENKGWAVIGGIAVTF